MDVVAVEGLIEDNEGDVGDRAEIDKIFDGEGVPCSYSVSDDYML